MSSKISGSRASPHCEMTASELPEAKSTSNQNAVVQRLQTQVQPTMVPDSLVLNFFKEASSSLLDEKILVTALNDELDTMDGAGTSLDFVRGKVLDQQRQAIQRVVAKQQQQDRSQGNVATSTSYVQVQERLGGLASEHNLSPQLKQAMDEMTECARLALCNAVLYVECCRYQRQGKSSGSNKRTFQDSGRLDRNKLVDYLGLCLASLKLQRVQQFICRGRPLFDDLLHTSKNGKTNGDSSSSLGTSTVPAIPATATTATIEGDDNESLWQQTTMHFPQTRLEYTQRLLAQGVGWDPDFLTDTLRMILVETSNYPSRPADAVAGTDTYDDTHNSMLGNDPEIRQLFEQTVDAMKRAVSDASKASLVGRTGTATGATSSIKDLNDINEGGVTRILSVQYSEIEVTPDGRRINIVNAAPGTLLGGGEIGDDNRAGIHVNNGSNGRELSDEVKKEQIRMASNAAVLQQEILGKLFAMDEHDRDHVLSEAAEASKKFENELMALPPGPRRIEYLQSIPSDLSQKLAMHKCWSSMLQQNGGRPPKIAPKCHHHNNNNN